MQQFLIYQASAQRFAAKQMKMQVKNGLTAIRAGVCYYPITVSQIF